MKKLLCAGLLLCCSLLAWANPSQQPLPAEQAFAISASLFGHDTVVVDWTIAPNHYLYRDRFHFKVISPATASIGQILYPAGIPKQDEIFGKYQVYENTLKLPVPVIHFDPENTVLEVSYQGCAEDGYCYPPISHQLRINFTQGTVTLTPSDTSSPVMTKAPRNTQEKVFLDVFSDHHIIVSLLLIFGSGILLSFTPCVLPMIPILSGIIVGHQKTIMAGKAFRLSLVYVLSMALTYAAAGMVVGWLGSSVQSMFQTPAVIVTFSLLFVLLALSFFGLYSIKLPAKFEEKIANISHHQKSGHYLGVAAMGCLATLIVSPCITPALVGILTYISKTGNAALGGAALFSLGLGMGLPLLLIGAAGHKLLPKAGAWMNTVEYIFGVLFLAMAIWMLDRLISPTVELMLWAALLISCAVYMGALSGTPNQGWGKLWKGLGLLMLIYGILLTVGAAQGNDNPLRPLSGNGKNQPSTTTAAGSFIPVKNLADIETAVKQAQAEKKPVLLDFYADWCVSCQIMERSTFRDPKVVAALANFIVLKADVTHNDAAAKGLLQHFGVIAPPTFLLFNARGELMAHLKRVGEMNAEEFLGYLQELRS